PMNEYYKGILQITVIGSIVLRMEFLKWAISLTIIFAAFWLSTVGIFEGQRYSNILLFLASTSLTCALGVYNIELTRRRAFLMRVDIQQKSDKLVEMNAREVQSAKSKNAMINILAHFYNTPIHQIKGFSELLQSSGDTLDEDTSAGYLDQIINSTVSLNRFTQKVLEYNTLPEVPKVADFTTVSIESILKPAIDDASALTTCKTDIEDFKITGPADQLTMIMTSLVDNIAEHAGDVSLISITALIENDIARIEISDNGTGLTTAQFAESVLPFQELTKFMAMGEKVPMGLRYAEKVLNMLGGEIQAIEGLAGTKLQLTFPAIYDAQNDPWLEHEQATA
ncbi:MAG: HAMP domain-containing sensor histidine kinase, partial [Parvularculaceae bacterium]